MPMNTLRTALLALVVAAAFRAAAQPVYTFRVKVGIDRESVDSLGGRDRVVQLTEDMFRRVNRAFNYGAQLHAVYDFVVDWDAFYIYDGVSADQIRKPHPDHDYLVVMDGYKSDPRETGGGWYGDGIQAIYHSRTHNDRFNSPFEKNAIDGIIHEFGHALHFAQQPTADDEEKDQHHRDRRPPLGQGALGERMADPGQAEAAHRDFLAAERLLAGLMETARHRRGNLTRGGIEMLPHAKLKIVLIHSVMPFAASAAASGGRSRQDRG